MKLSLAITTFNRFEYTVESFAQVINDPRIDDIVILDDCSIDGSYEKLRDHFNGNEKVKVIRQAQNRGMLINKFDAVAHANNHWVILLDSDNIIGKSYLESLWHMGAYHGAPQLYPETIYVPEFAKPQFDYRRFANQRFHKYNVVDLINDRMGNCLLNTCNYLVHRERYMEVFKDNPEMKGTDTLWFNYLWLKAGYSFYVVNAMQYYHRVHDGSTWSEHAAYNMKMAEKINREILSL